MSPFTLHAPKPFECSVFRKLRFHGPDSFQLAIGRISLDYISSSFNLSYTDLVTYTVRSRSTIQTDRTSTTKMVLSGLMPAANETITYDCWTITHLKIDGPEM